MTEPGKNPLIKVCDDTWYDKCGDLFFTKDNPPKILNRPLSISLRVGWYCNLACKVCLSDSGTHRELKPSSFDGLLKGLSELYPIRIVWTGGEPLLYNIRNDLKQSIESGNLNVITTNLTKMNSLGELDKEIFWDVSLYGWDERSYLSYTDRGVFKSVEKNLHTLFDAGYSVGISIRVDTKWTEYLPQMLKYISKFPFRKLLLLNTICAGRITAANAPISIKDFRRIEELLQSADLNCPAVLPFVPSKSNDFREGYLLIQKQSGSERRYLLNEKPCISVSELVKEIIGKGATNFKLFTLQQYCFPRHIREVQGQS